MPEQYLIWGCSDNTGCQSYERAHRAFVKDAWAHTNQKEPEGQVMLRNNRERKVRRVGVDATRYVAANPDDDFNWGLLPPAWIHSTIDDSLQARREREVIHYPIHMAATQRFRKHREHRVAVGGSNKKMGSARCYISIHVINTPDDVYVRDNPGYMYLNQSLSTFLINFYGEDLRIQQVSYCMNTKLR